jgi:hypothetical protein
MKLKSLVVLTLMVSAINAQTVIPTGSTLVLHICAGLEYCNEVSCYTQPAPAGVPITFSMTRYSLSGGHNHTGGPTATYPQGNPMYTNANGCVDQPAAFTNYAGVFDVFASNPYYGTDTLQVWTQSPYPYSTALVIIDTAHTSNKYLTQVSAGKVAVLRSKFYLQGTINNPYSLEVLRASNNWGGWLDGYLSVPIWYTSATVEVHSHGYDIDARTYPLDSVKNGALAVAVTQAGCSMLNYGTWAHITCQ